MVSEDQQNEWLVLKFGGTSVSSADAWKTIAKITTTRVAEGYRPLIVHSALAGVSDLLEGLASVAERDTRPEELSVVKGLHLELAEGLGLDGKALLAPYFEELENVIAGIVLVGEVTPRTYARVLALGELMATVLGAAYLEQQDLDVSWFDARDVLTSVEHDGMMEAARIRRAVCDFDPDPDLQQKLSDVGSQVLLTQGFIARSPDGRTVTLGRGGSDTSAAYFAAKLEAARLEIWTDVPGLFSADPRLVPSARLLRSLHYLEAQEVALTGGAVLHPRCISPVRRGKIPLWVKCTHSPDEPGTVISDQPNDDSPRLKALSGREGVVLVSMETVGMWQEVGFLAKAFKCFSDLGLSVDLVSTSESNVTVTLDSDANDLGGGVLEQLERKLALICRVSVTENVAVVSLVGHKIRAILHELGPALEIAEEHKIHLVTQAASDLNLSLVVEEGQSDRLIRKLHDMLVNPAANDPVFGPAWGQAVEHDGEAAHKLPQRPQPWWMEKRERLIELADQHSSAYVYDLQTVDTAIENLKEISSVDRFFFAMKANNNRGVLRRVFEAGLGFECVSPGEIERVLGLFPDIDRHRILYTPNFAPRVDYEFGLDKGVRITLDNLFPLQEWGELFAGKDVILRIDIGVGRGHHRHVRTGGNETKFGIPFADLDEVRALMEQCGAQVVGLHAHAGSGIFSPDHWQEVGSLLADAIAHFPDAVSLDLGGGLGVPETPEQTQLDLQALDESLASLKKALPGRELWLEPGRYLVAEAGVLVTRVTQTKGKGAHRYVGVSTGMNSLIRPALYGSYHEIANLTRNDAVAGESVSVVGPNCESGDRLGSERILPLCSEGDVLAIATAGAYGAVMSSHYNLRPPAIEIAI